MNIQKTNNQTSFGKVVLFQPLGYDKMSNSARDLLSGMLENPQIRKRISALGEDKKLEISVSYFTDSYGTEKKKYPSLNFNISALSDAFDVTKYKPNALIGGAVSLGSEEVKINKNVTPEKLIKRLEQRVKKILSDQKSNAIRNLSINRLESAQKIANNDKETPFSVTLPYSMTK